MFNYASGAINDPVAIIGIGCRFPGNVTSAQTFWQLLLAGTDAVSEVPPDRWDLQRYYHPDPSQPGGIYTRHGGFVEQIEHFDASFFGISELEASRIDPQQRLLLEVSWEALEDAGVVPRKLAGSSTGVFVGMSSDDYIKLQGSDPETINAYTNAGSAFSIAANRISYSFDLHGPSLSIDTACSSALVAVHLACESIWKGECPLALAGGVNVLLDPNMSVGFCKAHMLSPNGRCRTFDAEADGYVRGEGAGMLLLKPLAQALADHDPIYATIRATSINQDGRTPGLHYPGQQAQEALLRQVYRKAGVALSRVSYVEAHGTGTFVGDSTECHALGGVFAEHRTAENPLRIGSVKTNLGHLESASGVASLIKAALLLKHRQIPANLHFKTPAPHIPFEKLRLKVQQCTEQLPSGTDPLIVGVNSFGFGGTNAHAVLEEFSCSVDQENHQSPAQGSRDQAFLLPISARSPEALRALAEAYLTMLLTEPDLSLRDLCFSASIHREHQPCRLALVADSPAGLIAQLRAFLAGEKRAGLAVGQDRRRSRTGVAFVFAGNGPQWWGMGRQLLASHSLFRSIILRCDQQLRPLTGWSLLEELQAEEESSRMQRTDIAQPALFALQIALVELWKSWGIEPEAVIGHSVGEIAAAYIAGMLSFEDAILVVFQRSRLQELTAGQGRMLAVSVPAHQALALIAPYGERVSLASINSPQAVTLSGDPQALQALAQPLLEQGVFCRFLPLNYAFHSQVMDTTREELLDSLQTICPRPADMLFVSTVTGSAMKDVACDADYWWRNLRHTVQFADGLQALIEQGYTTFLEIGPHPVLSSYVAEGLTEAGCSGLCLPTLRRKEDELASLLASLGILYTQGHTIAWEQLVAFGTFLRLPLYQWQRERHWHRPAESPHLQGVFVHPLLGYRLAMAQPTWEQTLGVHALRYLHDHCIDGVALFPAAGYVELLRAATDDLFGEGTSALAHLTIHKPLFLAHGEVTALQTTCVLAEKMLLVHGRGKDGWTLYAEAQVVSRPASSSPHVPLDEIRARCCHHLDAADFYAMCHSRGFTFASAFQLVEEVARGEGEVLGKIRLPEGADETYVFHPAQLDSCLQSLLANLLIDEESRDRLYLPIEFASIRTFLSDRSAACWYSHARLVRREPQAIITDYTIYNDQGRTLLEIKGLRQAAAVTNPEAILTLDSGLYEECWQPLTSAPVVEASAHCSVPPKNWLVFADQQGIAEQLQEGLAPDVSVLVCKGESYQRLDGLHFSLRPDSPEDFQRLLAEGVGCEQIVYLWGLDAPSGEMTSAQLKMSVEESCLGLISLVQALLARQTPGQIHLSVIVSGLYQWNDQNGPVRLAQAPLAGLARVIANEHPELGSRLIDIGVLPLSLPLSQGVDNIGYPVCTDIQTFCQELRVQSSDSEVLLRGTMRYVNRIVHAPIERQIRSSEVGADQACRLEIGQPGILDDLRLVTVRRTPPGAGEVEIAVAATGLNFKDVALAMGLIPGENSDGTISEERALGFECTGTIVALGGGVSDLSIGDEVIALSQYAFSSYLTIDALSVIRKPVCLGREEAASIMGAFLTAHYALDHLAHLRQGERVLIHSATGGVGLAALQIARRVGAVIFATAGNEEKRAYLRELGVQHVMDSRTLDFAEEIMRLTDGEGIDVVLNALSGEAAEMSLGLLRRFGRFVEIGKRDFFAKKKLPLQSFQRCLSYYSMDLAFSLASEKQLLHGFMQRLAEGFEQGLYRPLPYRSFSLARCSEAFRYMQQSRHIGKLVVTWQDQDLSVTYRPSKKELVLSANASYLITGGTGGFGLATARRLVERGARHLILVSRSGLVSAESQHIISEMEAMGAHVIISATDVGQEDAVRDLLTRIRETMPPLRGVVHAAMVLDDLPLQRIDKKSWNSVITPKMSGAWHLHCLTEALDFFVMFSSVSSLFGNPRQANYVAANLFLDTLARVRRSQGLPALTVGWGMLSQVGFVARHTEVMDYVQRLGFREIPPQRALEALESLLLHQRVNTFFADLEWTRFDESWSNASSRLRWSDLLPQQADRSAMQVPLALAIQGMSGEALLEQVSAYFQQILAQVLGTSPSRLDPQRTLIDMGLDSLMAMELRNHLKRDLRIDIPTMQFLRPQSLQDFVVMISRQAHDARPIAV